MHELNAHKVLVIDDEPQILKLLSRILSKNDLKIDTASDGREGIEKIDSYDYGLIITDIKMPDISGEQVCHHLKNTTKKQTPIIGMSGTPWLLDHNLFDAVLAKPCLTDELLEVIDKFLIS